MKKLLSVILSLILTASVLTMVSSAQQTLLVSAKNEKNIEFSDVNKDTIAGKAIYKLAGAGILVGDGDGTFRPNDPILRSELTKIVNSVFKYTQKDTTGFSDVTPDKWYYEHVLIAKKAGYILGHGDGTFKGEDFVTREQACAILCRVANLADVSSDVKISDAVSEWALPYVQKVIGNMFMSLEQGNKFRAQENITRAEFSIVYANFVQETSNNKPSTGGTIGGSTGGSTGGTIGGSTGGSTGGTTGGTTPPTTDKPEIDYAQVNKDMLANLNTISQDITNNFNEFRMQESRSMIRTINECIKKVIADGASNVIDKSYLASYYSSDINTAKGYFAQIKANPELKSKFTDEVSSLKVETIQWLLDAFDIDASKLMN